MTIESPGIVTPTNAQITDAIAEDGEFQSLMLAMTQAGMKLDPKVIGSAIQGLHKVVVAAHNGPMAMDTALALISCITANALADVVMQIQRANPISNAGRDGRVRAVRSAFSQLFERAVRERVMASDMDKKASETMKKINLGMN